ncbi:hypothetical protein Ga0100231_005205 [Opitutaceae bacterium TAV4]|nr:hypothetical protein Ga0100231_005205 [Opitutaceae bacterium TAV4]RRK02388.1 hypothetical protein Ga0100230_004330 [Opitutaceae bacterium TAV3]
MSTILNTHYSVRIPRFISVALALIAISSITHATIVFDQNFYSGSRTYFAVSADDLINAGQPTLASGPTSLDFVALSGSFPLSNINDGDNSNTTGSSLSSTGQGLGHLGYLNSSIEFQLDTTANTLGYDISRIVITSNGTDRRVWQDVAVSVRYVGTSDFVQIFRSTYTPDITGTGVYSAQVTARDGEGSVVASGIAAIRFDAYLIGYNTSATDAVGTVFSEYDVFGTPTVVPEPSAYALMMSAAILLGAIATCRTR